MGLRNCYQTSSFSKIKDGSWKRKCYTDQLNCSSYKRHVSWINWLKVRSCHIFEAVRFKFGKLVGGSCIQLGKHLLQFSLINSWRCSRFFPSFRKGKRVTGKYCSFNFFLNIQIYIVDPSSYAGRVSNMNLVYGLTLHEFSVAQVDRAPARCSGSDHRFEDFFLLCPTLVTCWSFHFHICFTELKIYHLSFLSSQRVT